MTRPERLRTPQEDARVTELLRQFDVTVAELFRLGVNPYKRCVCSWDQPHGLFCPMNDANQIMT